MMFRDSQQRLSIPVSWLSEKSYRLLVGFITPSTNTCQRAMCINTQLCSKNSQQRQP